MILKKIMIKGQIIILLPPPVDDDHGHGSVIDVHFYMIILFDGLGFCNFFIEFCTQISLQNKDRNNGRGCTNVLHPWTLKVSIVFSYERLHPKRSTSYPQRWEKCWAFIFHCNPPNIGTKMTVLMRAFKW